MACAKEKFWKRLVGVPRAARSSADDPRYERFALRKKNAATLLPELDELLQRSARRRNGSKELTAAGVPCGPVNDVATGACRSARRRASDDRARRSTRAWVPSASSPAWCGWASSDPVPTAGSSCSVSTLLEVLDELLGVDGSRLLESSPSDGAFGGIARNCSRTKARGALRIMAKLRMNQAIALAIAEEMERDERVVIFGEDIAEAEGPFKTSEGLLKRFGPNGFATPRSRRWASSAQRSARPMTGLATRRRDHVHRVPRRRPRPARHRGGHDALSCRAAS